MKLLTKAIKKALPRLYATDGMPLQDRIVVCKFFMADSSWIWYVLEGQAENGDFTFFGIVYGDFTEMGYFTLSELQKIHGHLGLCVERDRSVFNVPYHEQVIKDGLTAMTLGDHDEK